MAQVEPMTPVAAVERKPAAGLAVFAASQAPLVGGFLLLLIVAAAAAWLVFSNRQNNALVLHSQEVQAETYRLLALIEDAETGQRGYLLTGDDAFLDPSGPYRAGSAGAPPLLDELEKLTSDNPREQGEIHGLRPLVREKLDELAETVGLRQKGDVAGALAMMRGGRGAALMVQIRVHIRSLIDEENRLLGIRIAEANETGWWLLGASIGGVVLTLLLATLAVSSMRRYTAELEQAREELRLGNENLEATVELRTKGLREANEEVQRFAYIVSHDLRAPLVNIMGFTSELEAVRAETARRLAAAAAGDATTSPADRDDLDQEFAEALGFIKTSTAKMDRLIGAILKLSREGRRNFTPEPIDMRALVAGIAGSLKHQFEAAGAEIEIAAAMPGIVADRLAVEQVFTNLVENAVKYLVPGRPGRVTVTGRRHETPSLAVFEVGDNGRGIALQDHERIFELFRRAGPQDRAGEGIGLAHVRALVRRLGGRIECVSELARGSIFRVTLPIVAKREGIPATAEEPQHE